MAIRISILMLISIFFSSPVFSQTVEIFGGGQFQHLESHYDAVGWNGAVTGNFKHALGLTADFSGAYKSHRVDSSLYTYTFGPVITARLPVVQPFVHALFGGATLSSGGVSDTAFAMFLGGGLDIGLRKGIGVRLFQADWVMTHFANQTQDAQGRFSAGIVLKF
jgi:hypothetical protein